MSRIKQALEILSQEAASLAPEVRQVLERLTGEARLLIQPASEPLEDLGELLAELRREAIAMRNEAVSAVKTGAEVVKDEAAEVLAALTQMFEDQGLEVRAQVFEKNGNETDAEFHARVQAEIAQFENSVFADEEGEVDLKTLSREQLEAYVHELDALLNEAGDTLELGTIAADVMDTKLVAQGKLLDEANRKASELHSVAHAALGAIHDFDIKLARELLEKVVK